jgi:hypothetical protein
MSCWSWEFSVEKSAGAGAPAAGEKPERQVAQSAARRLDASTVQVAEDIDVGPAQADVAQDVVVQLGEAV